MNHFQRILGYMRKAIQEFDLIHDGDRIAVGVSGGKDSVVLLTGLATLRKFIGIDYSLVAITLDPRFGGADGEYGAMEALCQELGVEYHILPTDIGQIVFDVRKEPNPCSLCARMRRGALHDAAKKYSCNVLALGHHFDDVVETYMLSLFYEGRISCFQPVTYLDRTGITLIRPLLYTPEYYVRSFAARHELPIVHNPCPADGNTKRQEIKDLLKNLEQTMPGLRERIFGAIQRYPLKGWAPDRTRTPKHPPK